MNEEQGFWFIDTDEQHDRRQRTWGGFGWCVGVVLAMAFAGAAAMLVVRLLFNPT